MVIFLHGTNYYVMVKLLHHRYLFFFPDFIPLFFSTYLKSLITIRFAFNLLRGVIITIRSLTKKIYIADFSKI